MPITVDGVSAVHLLAKIEERNQDKRIIQVSWDNAEYPKAPDVVASFSRTNYPIPLLHLTTHRPHTTPH